MSNDKNDEEASARESEREDVEESSKAEFGDPDKLKEKLLQMQVKLQL